MVQTNLYVPILIVHIIYRLCLVLKNLLFETRKNLQFPIYCTRKLYKMFQLTYYYIMFCCVDFDLYIFFSNKTVIVGTYAYAVNILLNLNIKKKYTKKFNKFYICSWNLFIRSQDFHIICKVPIAYIHSLPYPIDLLTQYE